MKKRTMWTPLLAAAVFFMGMNPMTAMASGETEAGETVEILGEDGNWYEITYVDVTGFVCSDYLRVDEDGSTSSGISINLDAETIAALIGMFTQTQEAEDPELEAEEADETDGGMIYDLPEENEDNPGDFETDDV